MPGRALSGVLLAALRPFQPGGRARAPFDGCQKRGQRLACVGLDRQIHRESPQRHRLFERIDVDLANSPTRARRHLAWNPRHVDVEQQHDVGLPYGLAHILDNQRMVKGHVQRPARVRHAHAERVR